MAQDKAGGEGGKKKVSRVTAKKTKDKWKAKQWYTIRAPKMYNGVPIAETLADETPKLMDRIAESTLQDLSGDFSKMHVKLYFKVNSVKGTDCWTKFAGHDLTSDYIRRLTRRKHSKVDSVVDVLTQDGWRVRVKPFAITEKRAKSSQETEIRKITEKICKDAAAQTDISGFVKAVVGGDLAQSIYKEARLVYPLKRIEIRKSQVVAEPEALVPDVDVFPEPVAAPAPEPAATEEVAGAEDLAAAVTEGMQGETAATEEEQVAEKES